MGVSDWTGCLHICHQSLASRCIRSPIIYTADTSHTITEAPPAWKISCWLVSSVDSWGCVHAHICPSVRCSSKQHLSDQAIYFGSLIVQWNCWQDKVQRFLRCNQQGYTSWPVALKAHTSDDMLNSFACLSCLTILVSHHWSHSFKIFLAVLLSEMWCFTDYLIFIAHS